MGVTALQDYIQQRVMDVAEYIICTGATVRETAHVFAISKSTVHKDEMCIRDKPYGSWKDHDGQPVNALLRRAGW